MSNTARTPTPDQLQGAASANQRPIVTPRQQALEQLQAHTRSFALTVRGSLEDFFGIQAGLQGGVCVEKGYRPMGDLHITVPFSGPVSGEYTLTLNESVAAQLVGCEVPEEANDEDLEIMRDEMSAAMCELLNTAVGTVIGELAPTFPHLSFSSPRMSIGHRMLPLLRFGTMDLCSEFGGLRCHFCIDLMEQDLATSYARIKDNAEKTRMALVSHIQMVDRILAVIHSAVFWVRPDGGLDRRHSQACAPILGLAPEKLKDARLDDIVKEHLPGSQAIEELGAWVAQAFESGDVTRWHNEVYPHCPLLASKCADGRELRWHWLPVRARGSNAVSAMLVAVEDAQSQSESNGNSSELLEQLSRSEWSVLETQRRLVNQLLGLEGER